MHPTVPVGANVTLWTAFKVTPVHPRPQVCWSSLPEPSKPFSSELSVLNETQGLYNASLTVHLRDPPTHTDFALYQIHVCGRILFNFTISKDDYSDCLGLEPSVVRISSSMVIPSLGNNVSLECVIHGKINSDVRWNNLKGPLNYPDQKFQDSLSSYYTNCTFYNTLTIANATVDDTDSYTCSLVINGSWTDSHTTNLSELSHCHK